MAGVCRALRLLRALRPSLISKNLALAVTMFQKKKKEEESDFNVSAAKAGSFHLRELHDKALTSRFLLSAGCSTAHQDPPFWLVSSEKPCPLFALTALSERSKDTISELGRIIVAEILFTKLF